MIDYLRFEIHWFEVVSASLSIFQSMPKIDRFRVCVECGCMATGVIVASIAYAITK